LVSAWAFISTSLHIAVTSPTISIYFKAKEKRG